MTAGQATSEPVVTAPVDPVVPAVPTDPMVVEEPAATVFGTTAGQVAPTMVVEEPTLSEPVTPATFSTEPVVPVAPVDPVVEVAPTEPVVGTVSSGSPEPAVPFGGTTKTSI